MTMVLDDVETEEGFCPYKSCGAPTKDVTPIRNGKRCLVCFCLAAMSQRRTAPSNRIRHTFSELYHERSKIKLKSYPTSHSETDSSAKAEMRPVGTTHVYSRDPKASEAEDTELYHSIQVVSTSPSGNSRREKKSREKKCGVSTTQTSGTAPLLFQPGIQIFICDGAVLLPLRLVRRMLDSHLLSVKKGKSKRKKG